MKSESEVQFCHAHSQRLDVITLAQQNCWDMNGEKIRLFWKP